MKKLFLNTVFAAFAGILLMTSCDADAEFETLVPENPVMRPIVSLTAMEQEDVFEGVIDDKNRTIKLEVEAWTDLSNITVNLNIPKRATLISPSQSEGVWDLTQPVEVVVNNIDKDVTYIVTAVRKSEFIDKPLLSVIAKAGEEVITGDIDHADNTIKINFGPWVDLSNVKVTFEVKPHVLLVNPETSEFVHDFGKNNQMEIVVNDIKKDVAYQLIVTQSDLIPTLVDRTSFKEFRLDNDAAPVDAGLGLGSTDFTKLFDGRYMASPSDYDAVGWSPYVCQRNGAAQAAYITIDAGKMMYLAKFSAHRYWNEANVQVTKYDVYGYCQEGEPEKNGSLDGWTLLGSYDYRTAEPTTFAEGDHVVIEKSKSKQARYYRINATESWHVYSGNSGDWRANVYTFTEFRFWEYK